LLVPRASSTPVDAWSWPTWVIESETWVGSRVHLVGVSTSFEKNFYRLPFTPLRFAISVLQRVGSVGAREGMDRHMLVVLVCFSVWRRMESPPPQLWGVGRPKIYKSIYGILLQLVLDVISSILRVWDHLRNTVADSLITDRDSLITTFTVANIFLASMLRKSYIFTTFAYVEC
jgi:hypothetical protein